MPPPIRSRELEQEGYTLSAECDCGGAWYEPPLEGQATASVHGPDCARRDETVPKPKPKKGS